MIVRMTPIRYTLDLEQPAPDEAETIGKIADTFRREAETVAAKSGHAMRPSHAKATAFLKGELIVADDLPPELAQGLFATPARYEALVRFAQGPGELLEDKVSTHRGVALKLLGVPGARIPESREAGTQDFIFEPDPAFINSTPKTFLTNFKGVAAAANLPQAVKSAVSSASRAAEHALETVGMGAKTLRFFGHDYDHPLSHAYFSQAPVRWGEHVAKLALAPSEEIVEALGELRVETKDRPNAFREEMVAWFAANGAELELRAQLCTSLHHMPIEDASVRWPEELSPYRTVARLSVPAQNAYSEARRAFFDDRLAFQPGHSVEAHRPLGGIMRARLAVYPQLQDFRQRRNGHSPVEPRSHADVPD